MQRLLNQWKKIFSAVGLRVQGPSEKQRRRSAQSYRPQLEPLEPRQLLTTTVIDNGDPGFEQIGFNYQSNSQVTSAYDGDNHNMRGGEGTATWTFDNLEEGEYQVAATWTHKYGNRYNAPDAPFTLRDGETQRSQVLVDQKNLPAEFIDEQEVTWDTLDTISVTSGTLRVELSEAPGNNYVVADAIRIERLGDIAPELESTPATDVTGNEQLNQDLTANDHSGESDPLDFTHTVETGVVVEIPATDEATGTAALGVAGSVTLLDGENTRMNPPSLAEANEPVDPREAFPELEGWTIEIIYKETWDYPLSFSLLEWEIEDRFYNVIREQNRYEFVFEDADDGDGDSHCVVQRKENGDIQIDYEIISYTVFSHVLKDKEGVTRIDVGTDGSGSYTIVAPSRYTATNPYGVTSLLQVGSQIYPLCLYGCDIENFDGGSNPQPIIGGNYRLPYVVSVPERLEARLTFGGVLHDWVHYDTSGLAAGDSVALNLAADVPELTSGRHAYSIEVREITGGNAVTRTISGHRQIFNRGGSEFGDRWWLESQKRIVVADDGVSVFDDGAVGYWYEEVAGTDQFITPLSQFDTLVREDGGYTITDPYGNREAFNSLGLLVSTTDRNGNQTVYDYADADNDTVADEIRSITDPYEREKLFDYNNDGRLDTITNSAKSDDSGGRVTAFSYDAEGNLTQVTRPDPDPDDGIAAPVTEFSYDANGFMTGVREGSASASGTTMVGNFANRLTSTTNADETVWSLEAALTVGLAEPGSGLPGTSPENPMPAVTADQSKTTLTDERGFETLITFDRYGGETSRVDALDNTYLWDRDHHGRVTRAVAPAAGGGTLETSFSYDDRGNLIQTDYADGTHESWAYETSFNQLTSYTDQLDRQTVYDIDPANGNVLAVTRVVGQLDSQSDETDDVTRSFTYTDSSNAVVAGLLKTETDPLGSVTEYKYFDTANSCGCHSGLLKSITVGLGTAAEATTEYEYDEAGNMSAEIDPLDRRTEYVYDNLDRLIRMEQVDPEGENPTTLYTYNARDQLLTETDPLDIVTSYTYDAMGRLETITNKDANGTELSKTSYTYDEAGNLDTEKDELENITRYDYDYDKLGRLVKTTLPDGDGNPATTDDIPVLEYTYDAAGNLESETDPLMNVTSYTYDDFGRLKTITNTDPEGGELSATSYTYDAAGNLKTETDPLGNKTSYDYDDLGRLVKTTLPDPDPATTDDIPVFEYAYDAAGNLLSETDPLGNKTSYDYDDLGRLVKTTLPDPDPTIAGDIPVFEYTYDKAGQLDTEEDPLGNKTSYDYDDLGRLETITEADPDGGGPLSSPRTTYTYDAVGNLESKTDPLMNVTSYAYDALGRLIKTTLPDPDPTIADDIPVFEYAYDAAGNLLSETDPLGNKTSYDYDALGRLISTTLPDADGDADTTDDIPVFNYTYDAAGNLKTETDPLMNVTSYDYDDLGRLVKTTLPDPDPTIAGDIPVFEYTYDKAGQLTSETDPLGNKTSYDYDDLGRLIQTTLPDPDPTIAGDTPVFEYTYDTAGNLLTEKDALGNGTSYLYDDLGRLETLTETSAGGAALSETGYTYDAAGNRLSLTDPLGNETSWIYDDLNRPIEEQNGSGFSRLMEYDAVGNLTARTDRNDRRIEYGYDDLYRHTTEQWLDENETVIHQFDTAYDRAGQIISAGDGVSDYQYTYDHLGRVTDRAESYEYIKFRIKRHNDYDRMGNRTRTAIKFGGLPGASTETTYDNLYRTTRIEQYGGEVGVPVAEKRVDFSYDQAGQWDTITRYQDLAGQHVAVTTDYAFDPVGRMTGITHAAGDGTVLAGYGWTYDAAQRVKSFDSLIDGETVYDYDDLDQLTGATSDYQLPETYEYDEAGNRTGGPYVTDPLNQLQEDAAYLYRYDNEGNRTARIDKQTGETTLYEWDYRNRLTTISSYDRDPEALDDAVLQQTVTQTYDIWNQWIRRQVDSGSPLIAETYFIYDAGQMVMSFNTLRTSNMAQGRISSANRYLWGPAVDQLLAEEGVRLQGSEGTLWQLTDNLGTVRDLASYDDVTDTTSVVNHITYDAFGNVTNETAAVDHLFGYTGRAYDEETDLQNNHNRWYDAASGKWLSEDPIGFAAGDANLYRYVGNSATNATDPSGLSTKPPSGPNNVVAAAATLPSNGYYLIVATNPGLSFGGGSGHSWVAIVDNTTTSPIVTSRGVGYARQPVPTRETVPATCGREDDREFTYARAYPITKEIYDSIMREFNAKTKAPGQYQMRVENCTTWVVEVMKIGQIRTRVREDSRNFAVDVQRFNERFYSPPTLNDTLKLDGTTNSIPFNPEDTE